LKYKSLPQVSRTSPVGEKNETLYQKLLKVKLDYLTEKERQVIETLLFKHAHVFHDEETNDFPGTNIVEHRIPVGDVQPIRQPHIELLSNREKK
jgi:hypothetical protein